MRKKKKAAFFPALLLAALLIAALGGCGKETGAQEVPPLHEGQSDLEYVQSKQVLKIGVTEFAPLDYQQNGEWIGFDAELADAFAKQLGVQAQIVVIDWNRKTELLNGGEIDCIWNGMTKTEELEQTIDCSDPYLINSQVVVAEKNQLSDPSSTEKIQHMLFAVEKGSTGEELLKKLRYRYIVYSTQLSALQGVRDKEADAAVIDRLMAVYYTGDGQEMDQLSIEKTLDDEVICIGFRKGSDLTGKANAFLKKASEDGTIASLAAQYGIETALPEEGQG